MEHKADLQHHLNLQLRDCERRGDAIVPCGYHEGRARTHPFGFSALTHTAGFTGFLEAGDNARQAATLFCSGVHPAGGWYLVHEQRNWLKQRLMEQIGAWDRGRPVRILEAGIAGFVHHYTFLLILYDCLQLNPPPDIELCVVDKCVYPIEQLRVLEQHRTTNKPTPTRLTVGGHRLPVSPGIRRILDLRQTPDLTTDLQTMDLGSDKLQELGPFDIVTEHFLTSVLDADFDEIEKIWANCARAIAPGGHFFCAVGTTPGTEPMKHYLAMAERSGLTLIDDHTEVAWDPYGLDRQEILHLLGSGAEGIGVGLDNSLLHFRKDDG